MFTYLHTFKMPGAVLVAKRFKLISLKNAELAGAKSWSMACIINPQRTIPSVVFTKPLPSPGLKKGT